MSIIEYDSARQTAHNNNLIDEFKAYCDSQLETYPELSLSESQLFTVWAIEKIGNLQSVVLQLVSAIEEMNAKKK